MPKPTKLTRIKPGSKPAKKPAAPSAASTFDSTAAASAAAAIVGHKITQPAQGAQTTESSSFRNMKDSLTKTHTQTMGGLLDKISSPGQKKSAVPFADGKQVAHNQTFGADVSRRSVPRRTGG
jgi:hypothetical protein